MSKQTEALKLALEALKQIDEAMPFPVAKFAQAAIREALAEQPASKPWVGLTDEEQQAAYDAWQQKDDGWGSFYDLIEAKLREKNA